MMSYERWGQPGLPKSPAGQFGPPGQFGPSSGQPGSQMPMMRASHSDRERTIDVLKAGFTEGRLDQAEYEQRLGRAQQAQTYGELHLLIADLPQGPMAVPAAPPQQYPAPRPYAPPVPATFLPPPPRNNGSATAAMILGAITPVTYGLTAIPAVILGHKARAEIRRTGERGDGMALAGVVIGWLAIGFGMLIALAVIAASS